MMLRSLLLLCVFFLTACAPRYESVGWPEDRLRVHALFSDHAVVQRGEPIAVRGTDAPGTRVTVEMAGATEMAQAQADGRWMAHLPALPAGGPHTITVRGTGLRVVRDVMVGDVFLCGGQSNMAWPLKRTDGSEIFIAASSDPGLRLLTVPEEGGLEPLRDVKAVWQVSSPASAGEFSAVAWYMGNALRQADPGVPVGMIMNAWNGARAESYLPLAAMKANPTLADSAEAWEGELSIEEREAAAKEHADAFAAWFEEHLSPPPADRGTAGGWHTTAYDDSTWQATTLPDFFELDAELELEGAVWYRRTVTIPPEWAGRPLRLALGRVDDVDETYFDGELAGRTFPDTPFPFRELREYLIPPERVRAGEAVIAVRAVDISGVGGMSGPAEAMSLVPADAPAEEPIALAGEWRIRPERRLLPGEVPQPPSPPWVHQFAWFMPEWAWNGTMEPLLPLAVAGVAWYQGEANTMQPTGYEAVLRTLIATWRDALGGAEDLPFFIVQLAPYDDPNPIRRYAQLRETQARVAATTPNTALVVTLDAGDCADIHPRNKKPVGDRLAAAARAMVRGEDVAYRGPEYLAHMYEDSAIVVEFAHAGEGLALKDDATGGWFLAGADRLFFPAKPEVRSAAEVVLRSASVPEPLQVRYAWAQCPEGSLVNSAGLPAAPFRTDTWNKGVFMIELPDAEEEEAGNP